jgi:Prolyl oligopeptidase family
MLPSPAFAAGAEVVSFPSGKLTLQGMLYKPQGTGPFPAVVYNHGSAPGMLSEQAFEALGPVFASHGWVFFGPYRRGQGRSASAGPYIGDAIAAATTKGGTAAGAATMVRLLATDHLNDQLAALAWLRTQSFVQPDRIAVAGNSFGGILVVLGAEQASLLRSGGLGGRRSELGRSSRSSSVDGACSPQFARSRSWIKWLLLAIPVAALFAASALFLAGAIAVARVLLIGGIGMGILFTAPFLPVYTPSRGRIFRYVKWVVLIGMLGMAFGPDVLRWSWLLISCLWLMARIEWTRVSIRRKLPVAQWPKALYL